MSKASEWAKVDKARRDAMEEVRERIDREWPIETPGMPRAFMVNGNWAVSINAFDGVPRLALRGDPFTHGVVYLDAAQALEMARWILDTFGEGT